MSIQTNVLENGEWVTRTLTTDELMRGDGISRRRIGRQPPSKPPMCGLLTRTIMDSPVVHWTLPIKIRPSNQNDIALIGVCVLNLYLLPLIIPKATSLASHMRNLTSQSYCIGLGLFSCANYMGLKGCGC